jgi:hypothetical protein
MTRVCLNVDARLWKTQGNIESDSYAFPRPDSLGDIWPNYTRLIQRHPHNAEAFPSYALEFPTEIAGVALIESSSPRQIDGLMNCPAFAPPTKKTNGQPNELYGKTGFSSGPDGAAAGSLHKWDRCHTLWTQDFQISWVWADEGQTAPYPSFAVRARFGKLPARETYRQK